MRKRGLSRAAYLGLKFKNAVIMILKKLRQNKRRILLDNLRELEANKERRRELRKQYVRRSLMMNTKITEK